MTLAPRGLIVTEANNTSALRKARNMFTVEEIESRIRQAEISVRRYRLLIAEDIALGKDPTYWSNRADESERLIAFWNVELSKAQAWQFATA
jgi:hypothetical protein